MRHIVVDLTRGNPTRWDEKDKTLYTSSFCTVFESAARAKAAVNAAHDYWDKDRDRPTTEYLVVRLGR